jgi:hypothetical protein
MTTGCAHRPQLATQTSQPVVCMLSPVADLAIHHLGDRARASAAPRCTGQPGCPAGSGAPTSSSCHTATLACGGHAHRARRSRPGSPSRPRRPAPAATAAGTGAPSTSSGDLDAVRGQHAADRHDPETVLLGVDELTDQRCSGSCSRAKKLVAALRISMVCSSSRFLRRSSRISRAASLLTPLAWPSSISAWRARLRRRRAREPNVTIYCWSTKCTRWLPG